MYIVKTHVSCAQVIDLQKLNTTKKET